MIGSINQDVTVRVQRFPLPGETVLGVDVTYGLGGKGANQAVAAARTGVSTSLLGSVGDDAVGGQLVRWLEERGVDTSSVARVGVPSGTAHIVVNASGENQIVVVPGANALTTTVDEAAIARASVVVLQGEVPVATIEHAVAIAQHAGKPVLLNLAPAVALTPETLAAVEFLVVNESEAGLLLGRSLSGTMDNALAAVARAYRHQCQRRHHVGCRRRGVGGCPWRLRSTRGGRGARRRHDRGRRRVRRRDGRGVGDRCRPGRCRR